MEGLLSQSFFRLEMVVCTYFAKLEEDSCFRKTAPWDFQTVHKSPRGSSVSTLSVKQWTNQSADGSAPSPLRLFSCHFMVLDHQHKVKKSERFPFNLFYTPQISRNATVISVDHYFQLLLFILTKLFIFFLRMPAEYYLSHTVLLRRGNNAACSRFSPTLTCVKHILMFQLWRKGHQLQSI